MEKVRPWSGQPSDRGRLKNRTSGWVLWVASRQDWRNQTDCIAEVWQCIGFDLKNAIFAKTLVRWDGKMKHFWLLTCSVTLLLKIFKTGLCVLTLWQTKTVGHFWYTVRNLTKSNKLILKAPRVQDFLNNNNNNIHRNVVTPFSSSLFYALGFVR